MKFTCLFSRFLCPFHIAYCLKDLQKCTNFSNDPIFLSIFVYLVLCYISLFINFRFVLCIAVILISYIKMLPDSNLEQRKNVWPKQLRYLLAIDSLIGLKSVFDRIPRKQETAHDSPLTGPHPSDHGWCSFIQQTLIKGFWWAWLMLLALLCSYILGVVIGQGDRKRERHESRNVFQSA